MTDRELMQQALDALTKSDYLSWRFITPLIEALRERLKQPEQEPVAWKDMAFARLGVVRDKMHPDDVKTIQRFLDGDYTTPQPDTSGTRSWFTVDELNAWADKYEAKLKEKNT